MDTQWGTGLLGELIVRHWASALFLTFTLATILVLIGVRWWLKRRWQRLLQEQFDEEEELDVLTPLGPQDQQALELIKHLRKEVWDLPEAELQLNVEALSQRATHIVRSISGIYYPEVEIPQYEASLVEILQLIRRVSARLSRLGSILPFKFLGNRKLSDYQRYYQVYRKINENPFLQVLKKNPYLYKAARWAVNMKNLSNPLYWAGRELSREGYFYILRWFTLTFISQVGREAMRLYSGRHFQTEEDRDAVLLCYRLYSLACRWGGPSSSEWAALVGFVTNHPALEAEVKVHVLSRLAENRLPQDLDEQEFQSRSGLKWYEKGLKILRGKEHELLSAKIELIQRELESIDGASSQ